MMPALQATLPGGVTLGLDFTYHAMPLNLCPTHLKRKYSHAASHMQQTICCLSSVPEDAPSAHPAFLAAGVAWCSPFDTFVKETGRKLALARALAKAKVGRDDRRLLWEAYHLRGQTSAAKVGISCSIDTLLDDSIVLLEGEVLNG